MTPPAKVVCPNCKLENRRGETRCTGCGNNLPRFLGLPKAAVAPPFAPETPSTALRRQSEETQAIDATDLKRVLATGAPAAAVSPSLPEAPEASAVAWIHCEPLPPIALVPGHDITIGRKACRLLLAHTEVSRHHATLSVAATGQISITDHQSSNGTYVNGKRIQAQALRVGDQIKIGPYSIELWQVKDLPAEDPEGTSAILLAREPDFSGKLGAGLLPEALASIESRKRTGTLTVVDRQQRGAIRFAEGRVLSAEWGNLRGELAVQAMVKLSFGSFAFSSDG